MGASLTFDTPRLIQPDTPLRLRYGLHVHNGMKASDLIETRWTQFAEIAAMTVQKAQKSK